MMSDSLLISVRLHEGWYHGSGGTPSPARLFQALVAGAGISGPLNERTVEALKWLESQKSYPIIATPYTTSQKPHVNYVPNNDLDSKQGDYRRIGEIRVKKEMAPLIFDSAVPFLFAWKLEDNRATESAKKLLPLVDRIYQLGRCVDMAWAWAEILSEDELRDHLNSYAGIVRYPSTGTGGVDCPTSGSLMSLQQRYLAGAHQFARTADGKGQTFRQRPKPKWKKVCYEGTTSRFVFELRESDDAGFLPWPLERAASLIKHVRDAAARKMKKAMQDRLAEIDRVLIGRKPSGVNSGPTSERVRIIPLPSIGHMQADMQIRRLFVEVPSECPLRADDISWAVSGLRIDHPVLGKPIILTSSHDQSQLGFYGVAKPSRIWRSVTPLALPDAARRRIDPQRIKSDDREKKTGTEKYSEHKRASFALTQALRHAGIPASLHSVRLQREPFDQRGIRVEPFTEGTRFSKHGLWHSTIEFDRPVSGPIIVGNGRFVGLGLFRPISEPNRAICFSIDSGLSTNFTPIQLCRAFRRAVMSRCGQVTGMKSLNSYFSGHQSNGQPAKSENEPHLAFIFDPVQERLLIIDPGLMDRRIHQNFTDQFLELETAVAQFVSLRAGRSGLLTLSSTYIDSTVDPLFQPSRVWRSLTPYTVNRHAKKSIPDEVLANNIITECEQRGLPRPRVKVLEYTSAPGKPLAGKLELTFQQAIVGPLILGRTRYLGGGLFAAEDLKK
ncbi:type I-U CRISPR-associated protein Csb2 [Thalassoglobus sp.]|uniref:type I-G CRISPR-associated protein Csb2 n=1 Tax=Thalassoglobus sp. TaxID=2795869 RepID=UPI003AA82F9C